MGNSTSTSEGGGAQEHSELERKLQSDLAYLKRAFSTLSASNNGQQHSIPQSTLEKVFKLAPLDVDDKASSHDESALPLFISEIGPAITRTFFNNDSGQVDWPLFLSGFDMCCKQGLGAVKLKLLFAVFVKGKHEHELLPGLQVEGDQDLSGFITTSQLQDVFLLCWLLMCDSRLKNVQDDKELHVTLPNLHPLLASCYLATSEAPPDTVWKGKEEISVEKATSWILATIPGISDCFSQYIRTHLQRLASHVEESNKPEDKATLQETEAADKTNLLSNSENAEVVAPGLLTLGTAWAIGLSQRDSSGSDLVSAACDLWSSSNSYPTLLYRASSHGRGLNRFWTRVEGYRAPLLMLMSGTSTEDDGEPRGEKWAIGALIPGGFENKGVFYGNSGCCLFAISPHFLPLRSSGREINYVYSYKRTPGTVYSTHPKPEGVGFGGSQGKERLWLDDEFLNVTIQHHALDKSYHPGSLVPGQGYGPVKGRVGEVEVWGLGGLSADQQQAQYQHRENMFSEQRRKLCGQFRDSKPTNPNCWKLVDLKNFGNWKDSPEAAMMDMVSHPNQPAKEER